jgi:anthranilate phosphoribosyltransferase
MALAGIGFAFAPRFHAATRHAAGPRKELGTRTIFNLLGPLTNPANVKHQVVGVYERRWCEPMAAALGALGLRRAAVVHGAGGLDELAVHGETHVAIWNVDEGVVRTLQMSPRTFGCAELHPDGLAGGDAAHNAGVLRKVIAGHEVGAGERFEAVLRAAAMTAALGLELLEPGELDLTRLPDQYRRAADTVKNGAARLVLHKWRELSQHVGDTDWQELAALSPDQFVGAE